MMADPDKAAVAAVVPADQERTTKAQQGDPKDLVGPQFIRCLFPGDVFGPIEEVTITGIEQEVPPTKAKAIVEAAKAAQVRLMVRPAQDN